MSGINSGHHYLPTFQILMISDNVEFLWYILKMANSRFSKWLPQYDKISTLSEIITIWYVDRCPKLCPVEIFQCRESIRDIIIYPYIKLWWYRRMLTFCAKYQQCPISSQFDMWVDNDVPNWFSTLKNLINSGHHYLPTYQIVMISDTVDILRYCGDP
jgi:hypothetical protein